MSFIGTTHFFFFFSSSELLFFNPFPFLCIHHHLVFCNLVFRIAFTSAFSSHLPTQPSPPVILPFLLSSLLFLPPTSVYLSLWAPVVCLLFASFSFAQTENHKQSTETHTVCHSKGKHAHPTPPLFLTHSPSPEAELAHTSTANKTHSALKSLPQLSALVFGSTVRRNTDLFDAVWVDGGLRLQDADRLCLLGALRHLPHLLGDEVMDAVQRLHRPLDQTHSLCRACKRAKTHTVRSLPIDVQ